MSMEAVAFVSPFARACQAAHLLGRACEHVNQHPSSPDAEFHFQEALQISRAVQALLTMINQESERAGSNRPKLFTARALAYSALFTLYDVHSCVEPGEVETVGGHRGLRIDVQRHAIDGFKQVTAEMLGFAEEIEQSSCASGGLERMPLVVLFAMHSTAGIYAWYARETGAEKTLKDLAYMRRVMGALSPKWGVACELFNPFLCFEEAHRRAVCSAQCDWKWLLRTSQDRADISCSTISRNSRRSGILI